MDNSEFISSIWVEINSFVMCDLQLEYSCLIKISLSDRLVVFLIGGW